MLWRSEHISVRSRAWSGGVNEGQRSGCRDEIESARALVLGFREEALRSSGMLQVRVDRWPRGGSRHYFLVLGEIGVAEDRVECLMQPGSAMAEISNWR